jgi:hypothetical protein
MAAAIETIDQEATPTDHRAGSPTAAASRIAAADHRAAGGLPVAAGLRAEEADREEVTRAPGAGLPAAANTAAVVTSAAAARPGTIATRDRAVMVIVHTRSHTTRRVSRLIDRGGMIGRPMTAAPATTVQGAMTGRGTMPVRGEVIDPGKIDRHEMCRGATRHRVAGQRETGRQAAGRAATASGRIDRGAITARPTPPPGARHTAEVPAVARLTTAPEGRGQTAAAGRGRTVAGTGSLETTAKDGRTRRHGRRRSTRSMLQNSWARKRS